MLASNVASRCAFETGYTHLASALLPNIGAEIRVQRGSVENIDMFLGVEPTMVL